MHQLVYGPVLYTAQACNAESGVTSGSVEGLGLNQLGLCQAMCEFMAGLGYHPGVGESSLICSCLPDLA